MQIEWNWDLDEQETHISNIAVGDREHTLVEEGRFRLKGRCRHCWGGLIGKQDIEKHEVLAIRCRVCGLLLEGDAVREEYQCMSMESGLNILGLLTGIGLKYRGDATFVQKIFQNIERLSSEELYLRVSDKVRETSKSGQLSRSSLQLGPRGFCLGLTYLEP